MIVNATFDNVRVFNVDRLDVLKGQVFELDIETLEEEVVLFASRDVVLNIEDEKAGATLKADNVGTSEILFLAKTDYRVVKKLVINVLDEIQVPAKTLSPTAEEPENK